MIKTHRNFLLAEPRCHHANVYINPVGQLDIDIVESRQHHDASFETLTFKYEGAIVHIQGIDCRTNKHWDVSLNCRDANEINTLILRANEELETLMSDL
ncbi:hypothetical protein [Vibrio sp. 10N.261.51.F12]|uniref:hypothetical protein n=1 Tax=Vibrio sp. 10N.261.51.F12 TaxID=3229679 RepID=UPI00354E31C3